MVAQPVVPEALPAVEAAAAEAAEDMQAARGALEVVVAPRALQAERVATAEELVEPLAQEEQVVPGQQGAAAERVEV